MYSEGTHPPKERGREGSDFVRCRICGDHYRVISGRHLSKHEIDRETYMEEYGLSPDQLIAKDFRRIISSRRGYSPYGKKDWIDAIKKIHRRGESVFAGDLQDKQPYLYQQGLWIFGDWDKALRAAGFVPEKMRRRRSWDKNRIIRELRRMRKRRLPLYAHYVMKNHQSLFHAALRHYGSWNKALVAVGINDKGNSGTTPLGLLRELRQAVEAKRDIPVVLRSEIAYYFGSLRKAKLALKTDPRILNGWSKTKIIATLTQMHRSKKNLRYATARCAFPALVSAAEAYFDSWGKALYAAGINPNFYFVHHKWRKSTSRASGSVVTHFGWVLHSVQTKRISRRRSVKGLFNTAF
jgi:hypothetical protein